MAIAVTTFGTYKGKRVDQCKRHAFAGNPEILQGPLCLCPPQRIGGHPHQAHGVPFFAINHGERLSAAGADAALEVRIATEINFDRIIREVSGSEQQRFGSRDRSHIAYAALIVCDALNRIGARHRRAMRKISPVTA